MRRECDVETIGDFSRYYLNAWIGVPANDGTIRPHYSLGQAGDDHIAFQQLLPNMERERADFSWNKLLATAQFSRPTLGMTDYLGTVVYASVLAERSTSRGLRLGKLNFTVFNRWALRKKFEHHLDFQNYETVWALFNHTYSSPSQAFDNIQEGLVVGASLSEHFALYAVPECPYPALAYKYWTIGYMPNSYTIHIGERYSDYQNDIIDNFGVHVVIDYGNG